MLVWDDWIIKNIPVRDLLGTVFPAVGAQLYSQNLQINKTRSKQEKQPKIECEQIFICV